MLRMLTIWWVGGEGQQERSDVGSRAAAGLTDMAAGGEG